MIAPMGKYAIASYTVVKDMERFAFLPAMAFAQIITILVSNDFGKRKWFDISANIKKVVFLTSLMVFALLAVLSLYPEVFIKLSAVCKYKSFAIIIFPFLVFIY
jgi:Na+-driven multidrug efflux pump